MQAIKNKLGTLNIDFVGKRKIFAFISVVLVVASWVSFIVIGPNWGIDFTGGTEMEFRFDQDSQVSMDEIREALVQLDFGDEALQSVNDPKLQQYAIRINDPKYGSGEMQQQVRDILTKAYGDDWITGERVDAEVGVRMAISYAGDYVAPKDVELALSSMDGVSAEESKENNQVVVKLPGLAQIIERKLKQKLPGKSFEIIRSEAVGPKVGGDLKRAGFLSIAITLVLCVDLRCVPI